MEKTKWRLRLTTGEVVETIDDLTQEQVAMNVARGLALPVTTLATFSADRLKWTLNCAHVVLYRRPRG